MCSPDIFLGLIAILFPPLAVWVKTGICSADSLINILLCMLGYIPGLLHAWYIIAKFPENEFEYSSVPDQESGGRVTYVIVQSDGSQQRGQGYGTTAPPQAKPVHQETNGTWSNSAPAGGAPTAGGSGDAGEGTSEGVPPSYADAVKGDHKIQTKD